MIRIPTLGLALGATLLLSAAASAQIAVEQNAEQNRLHVNQRGAAGNAPDKSRVFVTGNDRNSVAHVQQRGATDAVEATQTGETNTVNARQRADVNTISTTQDGQQNTARIRQGSPNGG